MVILIPKELNEIDQRTFIGTKFNLYITILFMPNTIACSIIGSSRQFLTYVKLWTLNVKPHKSMCFHLYQIGFLFVKDNLCLTQKHLPDSCKYYFSTFLHWILCKIWTYRVQTKHILRSSLCIKMINYAIYIYISIPGSKEIFFFQLS